MFKKLFLLIKYMFLYFIGGLEEEKPVVPQPPIPTPTPQPKPPEPPPIPEKYKTMLDLHNQFRKTKNLSELKFDEKFSKAALEHSEFMKDKNNLSHKDFDKRVKELGCSSENVAKGSSDPEQIFNVWKKSFRHRRNIVSDSSKVGFGEFEGWWTAIFG